MKTTTIRQRNLRYRKELEQWIGYYLKQIKQNDLHDLDKLKLNLVNLEKVIKEYIMLNHNKGINP